MGGIFQAGLYFASFDNDPAIALVFEFPNGSFTTSVTRFGVGYSLFNPSHCGKNLNTNLATLIDGFAFYTSGLPSSGWGLMREWYDGSGSGAVQVNLQCNSLGALQFFSGSGTSTPIGSPSAGGVVRPGVWSYFECGITFNGSTGAVQCRVWGPGGSGATPVINNSSLNTAPSGNNYCNRVYFEDSGWGGSINQYYDDWYMLDTTGSAPLNTYLGNVWAKGDAPNANSATGGRNAWTPTTPHGVNWENVADIPAVATDYNYDNNVGDYDMFRFPALPGGVATVLAVQEVALLELDAAGSRTVVLNATSGGTDSAGSAVIPSAGSLSYFNEIWPVDPNTSAAWGATAAGNAELGVKVQS